jgi:hypothetical protein
MLLGCAAIGCTSAAPSTEASSSSHALAAAASVTSSSPTPPDPAAVEQFILGTVYPAFGTAAQNPDTLASVLTEDARLRWPNQVGDGKAEFVRILAGAFEEDMRRFVIAATNYKFLVTRCGRTDDGLRPVGLPPSIDIATFDPNAITPAVIAANPGLLAPSVDIQKLLQGQALAAGRFLVVARFKHAWMHANDTPYWYVDRFVVTNASGSLKVQEYEFTANLTDIAPAPTPLVACP